MDEPSVDPRTFPRAIVPVAGGSVHVWSEGTGEPAVVMEAGAWDIALTWAWVLPRVASFTTAVAYDRPGLGWSEASTRARTADIVGDELVATLDAAGVAGPCVFVGMSTGGLVTQLLAYRHPERIAGLVLVDSAHEDQFRRAPDEVRDALGPLTELQFGQIRQLIDLAANGARDQVAAAVPIDPSLPPAIAAAYRERCSEETALRTMLAEMEALEESQELLRVARDGAFPDVPIVVIRHAAMSVPPELGIGEDAVARYEELWRDLQGKLAALSRQGRLVVAEDAGHAIHHDRPDVVVDAIREVVEAVRG